MKSAAGLWVARPPRGSLRGLLCAQTPLSQGEEPDSGWSCDLAAGRRASPAHGVWPGLGNVVAQAVCGDSSCQVRSPGLGTCSVGDQKGSGCLCPGVLGQGPGSLPFSFTLGLGGGGGVGGAVGSSLISQGQLPHLQGLDSDVDGRVGQTGLSVWGVEATPLSSPALGPPAGVLWGECLLFQLLHRNPTSAGALTFPSPFSSSRPSA